VLFGDVWEQPELSKRDRSLITVATLTTLYRTDELRVHIRRALQIPRLTRSRVAAHQNWHAPLYTLHLALECPQWVCVDSLMGEDKLHPFVRSWVGRISPSSQES